MNKWLPIALALLLAFPVVAQEEEATEETEEEVVVEEEQNLPSWKFTGRFKAEVDGRWSDDDRDVDLEQYLNFETGPRAHPNFRIKGDLWFIENVSESDRDSSLSGLRGASDSDVLIRPLTLYAEFDDLWGDSTLRIGRQRILEGPIYNRLDGVYFKKNLEKWDWYVFGGWRASVYAESHDDPTVGGGVSLRLTPHTRVALDAYYVDEHRHGNPRWHRYRLSNLLYPDYPRDRVDDLEQTLISFSIWQDITQNMRFFGRYTWYEDAGDELRLELTGYVPSWDLTYELAYRGLIQDDDDRLSDAAGYYRILGPQASYDNFFLALHKPLGERFTVSLDAEVHSASDSDFDGYNRDYFRTALSVTAEDLFWEVDATASIEKWAVSGEEDSWAITGELEKSFGDVDVTLGMDYERWVDEYRSYNPWPLRRTRFVANFPLTPPNISALLNQNFLVRLQDVRTRRVRENVYAVFGSLEWHFREDQDIELNVTYEDDDSGESPYWRARAAYTIRF